MIYASDLDRTLIYSDSFLDMYPVEKETFTGLEKRLDTGLDLVDKSTTSSYMVKCVANELSSLIESGKACFIPVTARSIAEYTRIKFPFKQPEYAITNCGGKILHNGIVMQEWEEEIAKEVNIDEVNEMVKQLDGMESTDYKSRSIDGVYAFSKSNDIQLSKIEVAELNKKYPRFIFSLDKHKLYAMPRCIDKGKAINWLKHYIKEDIIVASGDSTFDIPLLNTANFAFIPSHKYIKDEELENIEFTGVSGGAISPLHTIRFIQNM